ncbi:MAG: hypothetical protein DI556_06205 [Rhodovulum sulfidophilum]|uniref:GAF domain-containing protein n=1 Tax=Rhodovulum sulfidophilum TaxID=35806 RepID=A0A2W5NES2_RHOSU|nr:MAG: hypothetical protein DI556_06205 [Rhodovulum sulfidophilum]
MIAPGARIGRSAPPGSDGASMDGDHTRADGRGGDRLREHVARVAEAAQHGTGAVFAEGERGLAAFAGAEARILVNAAGSWCHWRQIDLAERRIEPAFPAGDTTLLPIREGAVAAAIPAAATAAREAELSVLATAIAMALDIGTVREVVARSVDELEVMRAVAGRILKASALDDVLLLVAHETKRLLASDICGVLMREGDDVAMKSCVGHFSSTTARLRMASGVGVAGRVLETGTPCMVANYVESRDITQDFAPLARVESVRSALAVPIRARDAVTGVLEVWRRRPSTFTEADTRLLHALADLAAVAIDNALLLGAHADSARQLTTINEELSARYSIISEAARFQESVTRLMLRENPLPEILGEAARFTRGTMALLGPIMEVDARHPEDAELSGQLVDEIRSSLRKTGRRIDEPVLLRAGAGETAFVLPIVSGVEELGWLCHVAEREPDERARLAPGYVALASATHLRERRRVLRERGGTLEAILWDLLEGEDEARAAAHDRAREMGVTIKGPLCVAVMRLPARGADKAIAPATREEILRAAGRELGPRATILGLRGDQLRILCAGPPDAGLRAALGALLAGLRKRPGAGGVAAGLGAASGGWRELPRSFRQGLIALEVAVHRAGDPIACYGDLGVMGLLVSLRGQASLPRLTGEILGDLVTVSDRRRGALLETGTAFFECDCSQVATAKRLGVHEKTVAYRLAKISQLTGLNLSRHQDRLLLDVGLRLLKLLGE